jgi:multiple antibiotic resistance protein
VQKVFYLHIDENIAVFTLVKPILACPDTIVTSMSFVSKVEPIQIFLVVVIFGLMNLIT